jgi:beta-galactosidase
MAACSYYNTSNSKRESQDGIIFIFLLLFLAGLLLVAPLYAQNNIRTDISLDRNWKSIIDQSNKNAFEGFQSVLFNDSKWKAVDVPHNWDDYYGYRRLRHGNLHGFAWYRKFFSLQQQPASKRIFLFFEGVGSYATIWVNGKQVGYHAGGRTTFTLDITDEVKFNQQNILAVRADHPANIQDLPWICGGCSDDRGFSEGSQPMGIFRPVHLIITDAVRIEPFGVHIWNDTTVSQKSAWLNFETEVKNYSKVNRRVAIVTRLLDSKGNSLKEVKNSQQLQPGTSYIIRQSFSLAHVRLWSLQDPYLYKVVSEIVEEGRAIDRQVTSYGIRWIRWPIATKGSKQFLLNGKPVFINGIAEYEHLLGDSHAFSAEQIVTRVKEVKAAGFNAFRDAHQPHNLLYKQYWDSLGILWWPQMSAHDWYDTKEFRTNFKQLLHDWIIERRNSPSVVLWGLQNESKLPEDFARECTDLIRQLDPTASTQRLVTTCNGGSGTDWDVPQNWTGTYGGNPLTYSEDIKKEVLVGEYGAWRTLDLHTTGPFVQNGPLSEDRMTRLMEMKIRLAEAVKDSCAGQFMWLLSSHDNPGRAQSGEGFRELDRIGPVNYKGLLTPWEEPLDAYYMYRSNYLSNKKEPMVYIVSHTWPDRWTTPGIKSGIVVYSNCDEVELFNDVQNKSLGRKTRHGIGTHFQWDDVEINYNVLYAVGYVNGKAVSKDCIVLHHLQQAPHFSLLYQEQVNILKPQKGYDYLYRVNCGGPTYTDSEGNIWLADRKKKTAGTWGSSSWTDDFPGMSAFFASQRTTNDPIRGTKDWKIFQSFRYGREKLGYDFPVEDGEYIVDLYFTEPWVGGNAQANATGMRKFDVAINNKVVLKNLDIWKEAGHNSVLKKSVKVKVSGGLLFIRFPHVASGQAVISAIAIGSLKQDRKASATPNPIFELVNTTEHSNLTIEDWLNTGDQQFADAKIAFASLPPELYGAEWLKGSQKQKATNGVFSTINLNADAVVYIGIDTIIKKTPSWLKDFTNTTTLIENGGGNIYLVYKKRFTIGQKLNLSTEGTVEGRFYPVIVLPVTTMEPAYDLKPVNNYKAVNAKLSGPSVVKGKIDGKDRVIFKGPSADNTIAWSISTGVADVYSITLSYNNPVEKKVAGHLKLVAADGTLLKEEDVEFTPTREGKTNYISTTTGTMINAGQYTVLLTAPAAENLLINSLDVQ